MSEQTKTISRKVMKHGTRTMNMAWATKSVVDTLKTQDSMSIFIPHGKDVNQPVQMLIDVQDVLNRLIEQKIVSSYTVQDAVDSYGKLVTVRK